MKIWNKNVDFSVFLFQWKAVLMNMKLVSFDLKRRLI